MQHASIVHTERLQNSFPENALKCLPGNLFDDQREQIVVGIAVLEALTWDECQWMRKDPRQDLIPRLGSRMLLREVRSLREVVDSGGVRQEMMQCDGGPRGRTGIDISTNAVR